MLRKILSILSIVFLLVLGQKVDEAQFCETYLTNEQIRYELSAGFPQPLPSYNLDERLVISITAHIVRTNSGKRGISEEEVLNAVNVLNRNFVDTRLSFEVCKFNYIDKTRLFRFNRADELFLTQHNADSTINIYFVDKILGMEEGNVCGYTYYPTKGLNHLVLSNSCIGNGTTLSHEMGHFFGLYHTHEDKFGIELVNGSNCISAGDLICDTPADPGLQFASVNENCEYIGLVLDPTKLLYNPPVNNLMSYSRKKCRRSFTADQSDKMRINYHIFKSHLKLLDFDFTTPYPLVVRGDSLKLEADGGVNYLWNTGDTTSIINVQPDSSQAYSVYIFTASGCAIYKEFYAEVIGEDILEGPSMVCKNTSAQIIVNNSRPGLKYQLKKGEALIGEPVEGNDSTLVLATDVLRANSIYNLLIINEEDEKVLVAPTSVHIKAKNIPVRNFPVFIPDDTVCKGRAGEIKIPNSIPEVAYQLMQNGERIHNPVWGNGDTIALVTPVIDSLSTFDILLFNECNALVSNSVATFYTYEEPVIHQELYTEKNNLTPGERTVIHVPNTDTSQYYQLFSANKAVSARKKGNGGAVSFTTGKLQNDTDFCVFVTGASGCSSAMSKPLRIKMKQETKMLVNYDDNHLAPVIKYELPSSSKVVISLRELIGNKEVLITDTYQAAGNYSVSLGYLNLLPKLYLVNMTINDSEIHYQLIRIRNPEPDKPEEAEEQFSKNFLFFRKWH